MRILHVVGDIKIESGISSFLMNMYRNIDRKNIQFDFLVCNYKEESYEAEIKELGGRIYYCGNLLSIKSHLKSYKRMREFFRCNALNYSAIHLHAPTLGVFALKMAKRFGIKNRIIHSHSSMTSSNFIKRVINNVLKKSGVRFANYFCSCSDLASAFLFGKNTKKKVTIIPNAVDAHRYYFNQRERLKIRERHGIVDKTVICHVSNYSKIKNVHFLIDVLKRITDISKNYCFLFIGDGMCLNSFKQDIADNCLDEYCYFVGRTLEVNNYLSASDLLVLPSLKEGLPVTVIEAQASGMPCLVSDTITQECNLGLVRFLPLNTFTWSGYLHDFQKIDDSCRASFSKKFEDSKFNIKTAARFLENYYCKL